MKLIVNKKNIIELVRDMTWSGDTKEVSRKLNFTIYQNLADKNMPKISIPIDSSVTLKDDNGKVLFVGVIKKIDKKSNDKTLTYLAYDLLFYINKSKISKVFKNTPEAITKSVCKELGVPVGSLAKAGKKIYYPCLDKTGYEAIMIAYSQASNITGKKYIPLMEKNILTVIEKGKYCGVIIKGTLNLTDATYTVSSENVVNKVKITDKNGKVIKTVKNAASIKKRGTIQAIYKKEDGKNATKNAKKLFHELDRSASVNALGDVRAVSGYAVTIQDKRTGLYGLFYVESDSHQFSQGKHDMSLTLSFVKTMDYKELPTDTSKKKTTKKKKKTSKKTSSKTSSVKATVAK